MPMLRIDWDRIPDVDGEPLTLMDILPKLSNVKQLEGGEYQAACPCCERSDRDGHHLYLTEKNGYLEMNCQRCKQTQRVIMDAIQANEPPIVMTSAPRRKKESYEVIENIEYVYRNPDGTVAFWKYRKKFSDGHKKFSFKGPSGSFKKPEGSIWIYGLDKMQQADRSQTLYIVEGEKCADVMTQHGFLAISTCTGSKPHISFTEAEKVLLSEFKNKVIIPDNDAPGMEYVKAWENVKVLRLPDIWPECPPKGDVADYFDVGLPKSAIVNYRFVDIDLPIYVGQKYKVDFSGVWARKKAEDENYTVQTAPHAIVPYRRFKDVWTGDEKYEIAYFRDGQWRFVTVPAAELFNGKMLQKYAIAGLMISGTNAKYIADYFVDYVSKNKLEANPTSSRIGWHDDEFIPYTGRTKLDCGSEAIMRAVIPLGTFNGWLSGVQDVWKTRPEVCAFMAVGMASVLIGREQADTFVCELFGTTELGKTKALEIVASMFGLPTTNGLMFIMDSTDNFAFETLNTLNNIPLFLDENEAKRNSFESQKMRSPENSWLYKITAGKGRQRMISGHETERPTRWNTTVLVTGESSMTNEYTAEGALNRIIGVNISRPLTKDFQKLTHAIKHNYGHAVRKFAEEVISLGNIESALEKAYNEVSSTNEHITGKMKNNASYVWLAYQLMEKFMGEGALTLPVLCSYLKTKQDVDSTETVYQTITDWLGAKDSNLRIGADYVLASDERSMDHYENTGEIIGVKHNGYITVNKLKLDQLLQSNFGKPFKDFAAKLADAGYIIPGESNGKRFYADNASWKGVRFKGVKIVI